ncbi:MAG: hypothetical protein MJ252_17810 [archaeon]|nr:hypothetical protein [archaeon]
MSLEESKKKASRLMLIIGIGSMAAYNAILSQLFFYDNFLKDYNPGKYFTTISNIFNMGFLVAFQFLGTFISYTKQLVLFQLIAIAALVLSPFAVLYFEPNYAFIAVMIVYSLGGIANAFGNNSTHGVCSYFPEEFELKLGKGQAYAGILSNILNFIIAFFVKGDPDESMIKGAYIFFFTTTGVMVFTVLCTFSLFRNEYFIKTASENGLIKSVDKKETKGETDENREVVQLIEIDEERKAEEKKKELSTSAVLGKVAMPLFLMLFLYYTLFLVFPGMLIKPTMFNLPIGIKINVILFVFNICDVIGRDYVAQCIPVKTLHLTLIDASRFIMIPLVCFAVYAEAKNLLSPSVISIISLLNPLILGITNGAATSRIFNLGCNAVEGDLKGRVASSLVFFLTIGIFTGSFSSIKFQSLFEYSEIKQ